MSREDVDASPSLSHEISRPADRYGLSDQAATRNKAMGIFAGVGAAIVLVAWLWWAGLAQPNAQFETRDLGWQEIDDRTISVSFEVTVEPGSPLSCAVQALNAQYGIVGWVIADIPAATERTRVFSQEVRTSETAVTGLLYRCWLS